jgi:ribose transport system substrate-binding protein
MIRKRTIRKRVVPAAAALAAVLAVAACSSSSSSSSSPTSAGTSAAASSSASAKYTIAGVWENTQDPFWATFVCGAKAAAQQLGVNLKVYTQATQDETTLATVLNTALLTNPQGVLFNPIDMTPWNATLNSLMSKGTPIVSDTNVFAGYQVAFTQALQSGAIGASQVVNMLKGQSGQAVQLLGLASASWQTQRDGPIVAAVQKNVPGLAWLPNQIDGFDVNKGTQIISSLIAAHPNLKFILAVAGPEGQAVAAAIAQNHMAGKITVVAFDAVPAEVAGLKSNDIQLLMAQPAKTLGATELGLMVQWLKAHPGHTGPVNPASVSIQPPLGVITGSNVNSPTLKPFEYSPTC